jgi:hypothetical protein
MPSRFTQYGGAQGAEMALREMVAQRIAAEMEARKQAVETYKLGQQDRQIDQGDARIGLDRDKFGQAQKEYAEGAPQREAQTGYLRTQTADLAARPTRDADARAQEAFMLQAKQADELAQIEARGAQDRRTAQTTAGLRTPSDRLVQVMGPNGTPIWMPESQAAGMPAAQAARAVTGARRDRTRARRTRVL